MNKGIKEKWNCFSRLHWFCLVMSCVFAAICIYLLYKFGWNTDNQDVSFISFATFIFTGCTLLLTIVAVHSSRFSVRTSVCPILRLMVRTKIGEYNTITLYAQNIGNGPLFLKGFGYSSCCNYIEMISEIREKCILKNIEISELNMSGCNGKVLARDEELSLLEIKNGKTIQDAVFVLLGTHNFTVNYTDMLGNEYEEEVKPEIYKYKEPPCPQA